MSLLHWIKREKASLHDSCNAAALKGRPTCNPLSNRSLAQAASASAKTMDVPQATSEAGRTPLALTCQSSGFCVFALTRLVHIQMHCAMWQHALLPWPECNEGLPCVSATFLGQWCRCLSCGNCLCSLQIVHPDGLIASAYWPQGSAACV